LHVTDTASLEWEQTVNSRTGNVYRKYIREGEVLPGQSYYIRLTKFTSENGPFTAPRHKHDFDQIRVCLKGSQSFGEGFVSTKGCVGYFPSGTSYGPEYIEDAEALLIQWGPRFISKADNDAAIGRLRERGEFRDGFYEAVGPDGRLQKTDSITAVWEEVYQRPMQVPPKRYAQMVLMDTNEFSWTRDAASAGFEFKHVAGFGEDDLRIDVVRWAASARLDLPAERTQLLFVIEGSLTIDGAAHGAGAAAFSDFGSSEVVSATAGTQIYRVNFPVVVEAAPALAAPTPAAV
jgi:hypothetical protein